MKKYIVFYIIAFTLFAFSLLFFARVYKELETYVELTNRANAVHSCFYKLSRQINNAAVINPELIKASNYTTGTKLFYADSQSVIQELNLLKEAVRDSVNIKITKRLGSEVRSELPWLLKSDVSDSIIKHTSPLHIEALQRIDSLILKGIQRTEFLIEYRKKTLNDVLKKESVRILVFIILSGILLFYTTINLFRQQSKRKEKEEELEKKEKQFRQTLDLMIEGVQMHDFNFKYIYVNDALVKHSTYTKEELLGYTLMEKYPGIEQSPLFTVLQRCMKERVVEHLETEFVFPNGTKAFFELSIQPIPEGIFILSMDITERKKAESILNASEARYRSVVENMHESLIVEDLEGKLIYANNEFSEMFGFTPDEISKLSLQDYTSAESYSEVIERHNNRIKGIPVATEFEYKGKRKDGTEIWIEARVSSILENGKIVGTQSLERDITERKKSEEKILKANRLYAFISAINQSIVHINNEEELLINACNIAENIGEFRTAWIGLLNENNMLDMVRFSGDYDAAESMRKHTVLDFNNETLKYTPTGLALTTGSYSVNNDILNDPAILTRRQEYINSGLKAIISFPLKRSGKTIGIFGFGSAIKNFFDEDEITLLAEAAGDISFALEIMERERLRKQADAQLIQNEVKLKKAQSISHIGHWDLDFASGIAIWSEESCRIYGIDVTDNKQSFNFWVSFLHPDDVDFVMEILKEQRQSLTAKSFDHRIVRRDGTIKYIHSESEFEFDESGNPTGLYGIVHDITARKLAETEREQMITDIIQRNKNVEQFAYIVSHNLRGPVANILGISTLLESNLSAEDKIKTQQFLVQAANRLDEIVRDLNDILQTRAGIAENKVQVHFSELVRDIKLNMPHLLEKDSAQILTDFSVIDYTTTVKSYIYSIFYNLITNSVKYRQQGQALVIQIRSDLDNGKIKISFKDNGTGIDLKLHGEKLFGLYNRFHNHIEGKGLGLFMVKTQLEILGGTINVKSKPNEGTEFIVELPA